MTMTNDETYNGYSNRETWAFMLHLDNDQGLYEMSRDWAREAIAEWREYGNDDESGGYADRVIGERVVWQAIELWADHEDDLATRGGYSTGDPIVMWQREVGSVWRVDERAVGESIREDLEND